MHRNLRTLELCPFSEMALIGTVQSLSARLTEWLRLVQCDWARKGVAKFRVLRVEGMLVIIPVGARAFAKDPYTSTPGLQPTWPF